MPKAMECEVCGGEGDYPIIDSFGATRFNITCPVCFGTGEEEIEEDEEDEEMEAPDLPPRSTAAKIKTMDEMREHIRRHWSDKPERNDVEKSGGSQSWLSRTKLL